MRKLPAIVICPLLILILNGCTADVPPQPRTPVQSAVAAPPDGKAAKKKTVKRRPKLEAVTKQDMMVKPI